MSSHPNVHPWAGKPAPREMLIDLARMEREYYSRVPDMANPLQVVSFGTSGHRGTPLDGTFTEAHILAITQALCESRRQRGVTGPLFLGKDTHAASAAAERTALEVLAANEVTTCLQRGGDVTPTPAVSLAILQHNRGRRDGFADGIVITPSHNPPADGGFKYNPPNGGPADTDVTGWVQQRANEILRSGNAEVKRLPYERALQAPNTHEVDFVQPYVEALETVIDLAAIRKAGVKIGVDPLGGAAVHYWEPIRQRYGLDLTVVNPAVDPTFAFMTLDHDGKIRMDCSSRFAMAGLVGLKDKFDVAFGNDPDADRHGIVTRSSGLLNPNHYLATAIRYLLTHRARWPRNAAVGKTVVSSSIIDRVVAALDRQLVEVPVGFKWFAGGLFDGSFCFGGEESAGASFLRADGTVWTTDKDGLILGLLAAEMTATTGRDPGQLYAEITREFGTPHYTRLDLPTHPREKKALQSVTVDQVVTADLAGEPILEKYIRVPGSGAAIGGLKVRTQNGWFAARPSGTENIIKIYAESFRDEAHLRALVEAAREMLHALAAQG